MGQCYAPFWDDVTHVTHVKNIKHHYGGQPDNISVLQNSWRKVEAGKHSFDIMVKFCF